MTSDLDLDIYTYTGTGAGPHLVVLGAVHGNEHCGSRAIENFIDKVKCKEINIINGKITLIPICNPRAYAQNVRFTERNLNRFMSPQRYSRALRGSSRQYPLPDLETADYLLDIHSYSSKGIAFQFLSVLNTAHMDFAHSLGAPRFIYGWADAMQSNADLKDKRQYEGTTEYAREHGATAITLECGHHANENNADVAFNAILGAVQHLGIAKINPALKSTNTNETDKYSIRMKGAILKMREGAFTQEWKNMDFVTKGTVIACYDDGEEVLMPADGYIVLPMYDPTIGDQWFFWGVEDPLKV